MNQHKDKLERQKAVKEKHEQMEIPVELIKIQDSLNKQNLERQHKFNLDIFEKQAILTKRITVITATCSIAASIIGAIVGGLIVFWLNIPQQQIPQKNQIQINQETSVPKKDQVRSHQTKTKTSVQGESSLKNS